MQELVVIHRLWHGALCVVLSGVGLASLLQSPWFLLQVQASNPPAQVRSLEK